jgi:mevalonate kinase
MSRGQAPGKVLLIGEHAVVYGHPALAAAIPRHVVVDVESSPTPSLELPGGMAVPAELLQACVELAREAGYEGGFRARVSSEIPLGSGLGSSAALGVALARAFAPGCTADRAAALAMRLERLFHGAPSGVDPAACAQSGVIFFTRAETPRIERVRGSAFLCILGSGIARGTRSTVLPLAERRKTDPRLDRALARLGDLSRSARKLFEEGRLESLGMLFDEAHALLRDPLGVSCPELESAVAALRSAGALGAKLTGAGGGGAAIGLARDAQHANELAARTGGFAVRIGS